MSRFLSFIGSAILAVGISGCAISNLKDTQTEISKCQSPYAFVKAPILQAQNNDLEISNEEIMIALEEVMKDNCLDFSDSDEAYDFIITYASSLSTHKKEGIVSSTQENVAKVKVGFALKRDRLTKTFSSEQSLTISGKKILGIGKKAVVAKEDRQKLLSESTKRAYLQLINSLR
ncbi:MULTISPECIES: hypothetical protein [unclassified Helicobacter]|uniref:hypothetical protein n=1 Tax=unclassified Helicobacter TaxID=2593540 RepID=UPI000CF16D5E|nr:MULTISPECIES: hypothetical protein [unclassified Helicobacter]